MTWTLDQGIEMVRQIERALASCGWHAALGGGVLHRGQSDHDLDVIVFPRQRIAETVRQPHIGLLRTALRHDLDMTLFATVDRVQKHWRSKGLGDLKHVEVWKTADGKRVDLLVLS